MAGRSSAESTMWTSDTSLACSAGAGGYGSRVVAVSVGGQAGSASSGASYDESTISSLAFHNVGATGSTRVTMAGASFGVLRSGMALAFIAYGPHGSGRPVRAGLHLMLSCGCQVQRGGAERAKRGRGYVLDVRQLRGVRGHRRSSMEPRDSGDGHCGARHGIADHGV